MAESELSLEERVLLTIYYLRHYPTFTNLANILVTTYDEKKYVQVKKSKVKKMKELQNDIDSLKSI
ncbi:MAG: transposase family protein, partial [Candidatus Marithrix sp.]